MASQSRVPILVDRNIFSGIAAVVALLSMAKKDAKDSPKNWNMITMRVAFLLLIGAIVSPNISGEARAFLGAPLMFLLVAINMRTPTN